MRVMVVGGGGEEAKAFAKDLLQFYNDEISGIILADLNEERARVSASEIASDKVSTRKVDIQDHQGLVKAMEDVDAVMNYVGPFYYWGARVLRAAIQTGKHYIDIDDDSESTLQKLDLDERARDAGITAIVGLGSGPGTDNLLAKHGASKLDKVDEINIYWVANLRAIDNSRFAPYAVARHAYHGIHTAGPQYLNGEFVNVAPFSGSTWVEFDPPVGRAEVVYYGHPEAVTLPRYIKGVKRVTNRGGLIPHFRMKRAREAFDLGLTREEPVEIQGKSISAIDFLIALENTFVPDVCLGDPISAIRIEVKGEQNGQPKEIVYGGSTTSMAGATAGPASIGMHMIARGDIKVKGVYAPEGCIDDFGNFMSELKKRQI